MAERVGQASLTQMRDDPTSFMNEKRMKFDILGQEEGVQEELLNECMIEET